MSWQATKVVRDLDLLGVTPADRLVLYALSAFADGEGLNIWPGTRRIMQSTGLSRASVFRSLKHLRQLSAIKQRTRGGFKKGKRLSSVYSINMGLPVIPSTKSHGDIGYHGETEKVSPRDQFGLTVIPDRSHGETKPVSLCDPSSYNKKSINSSLNIHAPLPLPLSPKGEREPGKDKPLLMELPDTPEADEEKVSPGDMPVIEL